MAFQHPCEEDDNPTTNKKSDKVHGYIQSSVCYKSVNTHGDAHKTKHNLAISEKRSKHGYFIK